MAQAGLAVGDTFTHEGQELWIDHVWELREGAALVAAIGWAPPAALIVRAGPLAPRCVGRTTHVSLALPAPPRLELHGRVFERLRRLPVGVVLRGAGAAPPARSGIWCEYRAGPAYLFTFVGGQVAIGVLAEDEPSLLR